MTTALDLDTPAPAPARAPRPWWAGPLTMVAVATLIAALSPLVLSARHPRPAEPTIATDTDGIPSPVQVFRDGDGTAVTVVFEARLFSYQREAYCQLTVDGQTVRRLSADGWPAVCVWVRGADLNASSPA